MIVTKEDVFKAMIFFNKGIRKDFKETRWRRWAIRHDGKLYPPKDLLRCIIAIKDNRKYDRDSVIGGGNPINKHYERIGFKTLDRQAKEWHIGET